MAYTKTILGVVDNHDNAEHVFYDLKRAGYNPKDMSIIMKDHDEAQVLANDTGANVAEGVVSGAATGGIIGGIAGLLIGVGAIAVPGIGALLIGGPIATALGLTGAAAMTASGLVTGALAGGLIGALVKLGVSEPDARMYEERIRAGAILLAVPINAESETEVRSIFETHGVTNINVVDNTEMMSPSPTTSTFAPSVAPAYQRPVGYAGGMAYTPPVETATIETFLARANYPAHKHALLRYAVKEGADDGVLHAIERLPDKEFQNPRQVGDALDVLS